MLITSIVIYHRCCMDTSSLCLLSSHIYWDKQHYTVKPCWWCGMHNHTSIVWNVIYTTSSLSSCIYCSGWHKSVWSHLFCCGVMHCLSMEHEIFEKLLEFYIICSQIYAEACLWCEPGLNIHYEDWIYQAYNSTVYQDKSMNIHWRCHITL